MEDFDFSGNLTKPDIETGYYNPIGSITPANKNEKNTFSKPPRLVPAKMGTESIWGFLSNFSAGFAKPNRFRIALQLPPGVSQEDDGANDTNVYSQEGAISEQHNKYNGDGAINIKCHTASFPERILQTVDVRQNGYSLKMPINAAYEPITFTFYLDGNYDTKKYLEIWQEAVMNFSNNTMNFFEEYVSDIDIFATNMLGDDVYGITLYQAYPLGISNMEMSYGNNNTMASISVTLSYKYWLSHESTQQPNISNGTTQSQSFGESE